jgi:hypothetical protein
MQLQDYLTQTQRLVHDTAGIDYTTAELVDYVNEARNRLALDFWCVRTYFNNLSTIVNQETYPTFGAVGGAKITNPGVYAVAPAVTFDAPPAGGTQATGIAVMAGTAPNMFVQQVAMTQWGVGYVAVPNVTFSAGSVTATATAVAMLNLFDIYTVSYMVPPGSQGSRRQMLLWAPYAAFNAVFRINTVVSGPPGCWTLYKEQDQLYLYPAYPDQNYILEFDAFTQCIPLVAPGDVDTQVRPPISELVQYQAAYKALLKAQNFDQADYYDKKYERRALQLNLTRTAPRRPNIYQNIWRRVQRGYF